MGYNPKGFWHQVHASYLCQGSGPRRFGGWVRWIPSRRRGGEVGHGWKIGWHGLLAGAFILEGVRWWCSKSKGIRSGTSSSIFWECHYWEILKTRLLDFTPPHIISQLCLNAITIMPTLTITILLQIVANQVHSLQIPTISSREQEFEYNFET